MSTAMVFRDSMSAALRNFAANSFGRTPIFTCWSKAASMPASTCSSQRDSSKNLRTFFSLRAFASSAAGAAGAAGAGTGSSARSDGTAARAAAASRIATAGNCLTGCPPGPGASLLLPEVEQPPQLLAEGGDVVLGQARRGDLQRVPAVVELHPRPGEPVLRREIDEADEPLAHEQQRQQV